MGTPARGLLRLLLGIVRANRPWKLLPGLANAPVAALASAVANINNMMWQMSDHIGTTRLVLATAESIITLIVWLMIDAELLRGSAGP